MNGCHPPYITGNAAFSNYAHTDLHSLNYACPCPCHQQPGLRIANSQCWCMCGKVPTITITKDPEINDLKLQNEVLRGTLKILEERMESLEKWRKTLKVLCDQSKKPHKCPVCGGRGKLSLEPFDVLMRAGLPTNKVCHSCEGKGIVWG